jgi:CRISPR-associated exonuclease Cas4
MVYLAIVLRVLGLILLSLSRQKRITTGLPGGQIIYADTSNWFPVEKPLFDSQNGLSGKPDYIVKQGEKIIPIEVKSSKIAQAPYDSHIFQLAAYCKLVESQYDVRPPYGILHYPNRTFRIDYTSKLENELLDLLIEMRAKTNKKKILRSHDSPQRCARCGYQSNCDQRIS